MARTQRRQTRPGWRPALAVLAMALLVTALPSFCDSASAQELIRRRGLFDMLFGGPPPREALPPARQPQRAAPGR
ncbi:hypothetical protein ACFFJ2_11915, partial [Chelativorans intermedius]